MTALAKLNDANRLLAEAQTLDDINQIRDIAAAARAYAKAAQLGVEATNKAAEIKIRAERRAGEMLAQLEKSQGGRPETGTSAVPVSEYRQTLHDTHTAPTTAKRWQKIATIPEPVFEQHIEEVKAERQELTSAGVMRLAKGDTINVHFSSDTDEWATPADLFEVLDDEFNFTLDVCANERNAKCQQFYSVQDNGLAQEWRGVCWMNPPYGREIDQWMAKAHASAIDGATVVCLVPARTDTGWWWDYAIRGEIRFIKGRLKFGNAQNSAPFPSAVVVFYPGVSPNDEQVIWWGGNSD